MNNQDNKYKMILYKEELEELIAVWLFLGIVKFVVLSLLALVENTRI